MTYSRRSRWRKAGNFFLDIIALAGVFVALVILGFLIYALMLWVSAYAQMLTPS